MKKIHANNYVTPALDMFSRLDVWQASVSSVSNDREGNATNTTCFFYPAVLGKFWEESIVFSQNSSIKQNK